ncbi:MAG: phytoene desaturase [Pseudomonadota bacterium]|jgi:phytoene desaturase|nr:phytoene desaturase [Rubrivivax sp.]MCA3258670.1 phytoene desaturase [Rubrivivax sp.]MCE2913507.1 phytoene desaturase [Rubrivivax sp.]MCZ8030245.1 phytoene desaturase [Rubrivivax sp.]
MSTRDPHAGGSAVVIGSGFGGLAAAMRLRARGWRVQVLERLPSPGGRARVHEIGGHRFDAGPTIITVPHLFEELWRLFGRSLADDVPLVSLDPYYRIRFDDGTWFDYSGDPERMRAEVARFSPEDLPGYERLIREADIAFEEGFADLGAKAFDHVGHLVAAVPNLVRMRAWRTIWQLVCKHLREPHLRVVFSFHPLLIGGNPQSVSSAYALIHSLERQFGVHWAMGGTGALVRGMVRLLAERGVPVRCNADVRRIVVERGRAAGVELAGGERIDADIVVSNADAAWTYRELLADHPRRVWTDRKLARAKYSMSLFVWYFGTRRRFDDVPHHQMVLGPRYEGLLGDIFDHKRLADDFSLYLHRPTATDPAMAPPGCDTFYALAPVPHLDSGIDWAQRAEGFRQRIQQRLERTVMPGLGQAITVSHVTTPQHFHDQLCSVKGAAFGLEPRLLQSAWFRPHNRSEDLPGLYLVGAGTHPGAGVPGVLMSAKALESVLPPLPAAAQAWSGPGSPSPEAR